jgi:adenylate kinase
VKIVFLGMPGAGKGTQAVRMADRFAVRHASTGDIFRAAAAEGSGLGETVRQYLDAGTLVPDEVTSQVVEELVVDREDQYILDGYPRTLQQAQDLEAMLSKRGQVLDAVVCFDLEDETAVERLTGRMVCGECGKNYHRRFMPPDVEGTCDDCGGRLKVRSDSDEDVVRQRLREYHAKTEPLVSFYRERGLLHRVDASVPPDEVTARTEEMLFDIAGE